jgi:hypothetical protein
VLRFQDVAGIALLAGLGYPWSGPLELSVLNVIFVALFRRIGVAVSPCRA